jgi:Asp-tRNA(Asn)/Glu-tRNA(Gln) amidotransferase A subunit family amidase
MSDFHDMASRDWRGSIQAREASCTSVTREHLERIETVNPKLTPRSGFVLNGPETKAMPRILALVWNEVSVPLHGVPITI